MSPYPLGVRRGVILLAVGRSAPRCRGRNRMSLSKFGIWSCKILSGRKRKVGDAFAWRETTQNRHSGRKGRMGPFFSLKPLYTRGIYVYSMYIHKCKHPDCIGRYWKKLSLVSHPSRMAENSHLKICKPVPKFLKPVPRTPNASRMAVFR